MMTKIVQFFCGVLLYVLMILAILIAVIGIWLAYFYATFPELPPMARDLPVSVQASSEQFAQRVREQFPLPLEEIGVLQEIESQGFEVHQDSKFAVFSRGGLVCASVFYISWVSQEGIITEIDGRYSPSCL